MGKLNQHKQETTLITPEKVQDMLVWVQDMLEMVQVTLEMVQVTLVIVQVMLETLDSKHLKKV